MERKYDIGKINVRRAATYVAGGAGLTLALTAFTCDNGASLTPDQRIGTAQADKVSTALATTPVAGTPVNMDDRIATAVAATVTASRSISFPAPAGVSGSPRAGEGATTGTPVPDATRPAANPARRDASPVATPAADRTPLPAPEEGKAVEYPMPVITDSLRPAALSDRQLDAMPKATIEEAPAMTWFHRVFNKSLFHAPNWDGADNWAWALKKLDKTKGAHWEGFVNVPGQVVCQPDEGQVQSDCALGVWMNEKYQGKDVWTEGLVGTRDGQAPRTYPNVPYGINVRTKPGTEVCLLDSETEEVAKSQDGQEVCGTTSTGGDIQFVAGKRSRFGIWVKNIIDETRGSFETKVWRGPADDPKTEERINHIHVDPQTHPVTNYNPQADK